MAVTLHWGGNCLKRCSAASRVAVCLWIRASRPVMWGIIDFRVMSGRIDFGHFPNSPIPPLCHSSLGACTLSKFKVCIAVVMVLVLGIGIGYWYCTVSKFKVCIGSDGIGKSDDRDGEQQYIKGTLEECGFLDRYFYLSLNKKSPLQLISVGFFQISTCQLQYAADHQHSPMVNFTILHQHSPMFAANHNCALSVIGVLTVLGVFTLQWTLLY